MSSSNRLMDIINALIYVDDNLDGLNQSSYNLINNELKRISDRVQKLEQDTSPVAPRRRSPRRLFS